MKGRIKSYTRSAGCSKASLRFPVFCLRPEILLVRALAASKALMTRAGKRSRHQTSPPASSHLLSLILFVYHADHEKMPILWQTVSSSRPLALEDERVWSEMAHVIPHPMSFTGTRKATAARGYRLM